MHDWCPSTLWFFYSQEMYKMLLCNVVLYLNRPEVTWDTLDYKLELDIG